MIFNDLNLLALWHWVGNLLTISDWTPSPMSRCRPFPHFISHLMTDRSVGLSVWKWVRVVRECMLTSGTLIWPSLSIFMWIRPISKYQWLQCGCKYIEIVWIQIFLIFRVPPLFISSFCYIMIWNLYCFIVAPSEILLSTMLQEEEQEDSNVTMWVISPPWSIRIFYMD